MIKVIGKISIMLKKDFYFIAWNKKISILFSNGKFQIYFYGLTYGIIKG